MTNAESAQENSLYDYLPNVTSLPNEKKSLSKTTTKKIYPETK